MGQKPPDIVRLLTLLLAIKRNHCLKWFKQMGRLYPRRWGVLSHSDFFLTVAYGIPAFAGMTGVTPRDPSPCLFIERTGSGQTKPAPLL